MESEIIGAGTIKHPDMLLVVALRDVIIITRHIHVEIPPRQYFAIEIIISLHLCLRAKVSDVLIGLVVYSLEILSNDVFLVGIGDVERMVAMHQSPSEGVGD